MQIQHVFQDKEFDPIVYLIERIKLTYKVFTAKKAIIIIDNHLDVISMDEIDVLAISSQIVCELSDYVFEDIKQNEKIKELLKSA